MKVEFLEQAFIEFQDAIDFYRMQSEGLEKKFVSEVDKTISIITISKKVFLSIPITPEKRL